MKFFGAAAGALALTGCVTPYAGSNGLYASPIGNAPVAANPTPTAIGNAFTGYICSQCGDAVVSGAVNQIDGGNITSTDTMTTSGAGMIVGSSSAIGNSATFITTQRHN